MALKAPKRATSAEQAYETILEAILAGTIPAGTHLGLKELADQLGMSMMPVRDALRQLDAAGVVETIPHKGARVRELSNEDMEDTYLARLTIEGILISRAAIHFDEQAERLAREALEQQRLAGERGDIREVRRAHSEFHYTLYRAAKSHWLLYAIDPLWRNSERYRAMNMCGSAADMARIEHEEILQACVSHDPLLAEARLSQHLLGTVRSMDPDTADRLALAIRTHQTAP